MTDIPSKFTDMITSPARRAQYETEGLWGGPTLVEQVARHAETIGSKVSVVDMLGKRTLSYAELDGNANRLANMLHELGVTQLDPVLIQMPNSIEAVISYLAVLKIGAVANMVMATYGEREVTHMVSLAHTRVLITPRTYRGTDFIQRVRAIQTATGHATHHISIDADDPDGFFSLLEHYSPDAPQVTLDPAAISLLQFTSGTDSRPKGAMHTENTLCAEARAQVTWHGLSPRDVAWVPCTIGHAAGLKTLRLGLQEGMTSVLQDQWNAAEGARLIEEFGCSFTIATPPFLHDILGVARQNRADVGTLGKFVCGGAPVPAQIVREADAFGVTVFREYGSTETGVIATIRADCSKQTRILRDGLPPDFTEMEIRDSEGLTVEAGVPGEIFSRGPNTSVGFFADPVRTAATFRDGWVQSGDLGLINEDGYLTIVGRAKDIIIRGGLNITPREIEDVLSEHPLISHIAVLGVPDDRLGELVCACVRPKPGGKIELEELITMLKQSGMAKHKFPQHLLVSETLPLTSKGLIARGEAKALAVAYVSSQSDA